PLRPGGDAARRGRARRARHRRGSGGAGGQGAAGGGRQRGPEADAAGRVRRLHRQRDRGLGPDHPKGRIEGRI
ncbi:MAG: hypothetical protein AVDCRST_MAG27-1881, partial [uncultured Craurococcus sp.]